MDLAKDFRLWPPFCTVPPGEGEHHSRLGFESDEGPLRLAPEQEGVQADRASLPRGQCRRTLHVLINLPTSEIFKLKSGPCSRSYGYLPTEFESSIEKICQLALESGGENPLDSGKTGDGGGSGCPDMAISSWYPKILSLVRNSRFRKSCVVS